MSAGIYVFMLAPMSAGTNTGIQVHRIRIRLFSCKYGKTMHSSRYPCTFTSVYKCLQITSHYTCLYICRRLEVCLVCRIADTDRNLHAHVHLHLSTRSGSPSSLCLCPFARLSFRSVPLSFRLSPLPSLYLRSGARVPSVSHHAITNMLPWLICCHL